MKIFLDKIAFSIVATTLALAAGLAVGCILVFCYYMPYLIALLVFLWALHRLHVNERIE